jgi:hypothetical protein
MARQYMTPAHTRARRAYACVLCGRPLRNAHYRGEFTYVYDADGNERMTSVFLGCRCKAINQVSVDITETTSFMDVVEDVSHIPHRAAKITQPSQTPDLQINGRSTLRP